jgi:tripeptide aminopeptidase
MQLMAIPGPSCQEAEVAEFIVQRLVEAGVERSAIRFDQAHRRTGFDGNVGNLIFKVKGKRRGPRRMLMAHMDTVPICVGSRPVKKKGFVSSADPKTGLGADDRAGAAVVLNTALEIIRGNYDHPPLTFLWTVQEEIGIQGVRNVNVSQLGRPQLSFNFDGGSPCKLTIGATSGYRMTIVIEGLASHAGGAPEQGISAIAIAARAIADLDRGGWHGAIEKGRRRGTSNVGVIHGGSATNVVTDRVEIRAEARSHSPSFRQRIVREIENAFRRAAREVKNIFGATGSVSIDGQLDYESFRLSKNELTVRAAQAAVRGIGAEPTFFVCDGGLDANWMVVHGIPTVTLGCGQLFQHTVREQLDVSAFHDSCRIGFRLATNPEA